MAPFDTPGSDPASDSGETSSPEKEQSSGSQLSASDGVSTGVSSVADLVTMDRGLLNFARTPPNSTAVPANSGEPFSDADVMLRVKAGDQSAFTYPIQSIAGRWLA